MNGPLWFSTTGNETSPEVTRFGDLVVSTHQMAGTINGNVLIEEWVPGLNDWLLRATITTVSVTEIKASKSEPTRWRVRTTSHNSGTWGVSVR